MISIIIPIYKVEPYLRRCLDSVLAQTYTDLQIILVDDGSPDGCGAICDEYAAKDSRIEVIHQENRGLSGARNAGLALAKGEYIAFLDSDDYVDETMYEKLLQVLLENDADIAECGYRWVKPDVTYDRENTGKVDIYTNLEALEMLYFGDQMFGGISIVVWNKLYRAELFDDLCFAQGLNNEDVDFTPRALYKARRIAKLNENLYDGYFNCYRLRRQPEYRQMAKTLRGQLDAQYEQILSNPYHQGDTLRHKIFHVSPLVWYWCMGVARWRKMRTVKK